jgi:polyisoprenoid-binding protein YceI
MSKSVKYIIGAVVAVAVLVFGGTWLYINVIKEDAPERLTLESTANPTTVATTAPAGDGAATPAPTSAAATDAPPSAGADLSGAWAPTGDSILGYRVKEILFGQDTEGVGRTSSVTGTLTVEGTTVTAADLTVDMTTFVSDEDRRDGQFSGRIMDTENFPTGTLKLTAPVELGATPATNTEFSQSVTADLTLRGTTKPVTFDVKAIWDGTVVKVNGNIPIVFADWAIPNPSIGPIETEDNGLLEFTLVFAKA